MTTAQRIFLIVALVAIAGLMHFKFCEWGYQTGGSGRPIYGMETQPQAATGTNWSATGVFARNKSDRADRYIAIIGGIFIPLSMLAGATFVALGWKRAHRRERNRCEKCGYELMGSTATRCPECGWNRRERATADVTPPA